MSKLVILAKYINPLRLVVVSRAASLIKALVRGYLPVNVQACLDSLLLITVVGNVVKLVVGSSSISGTVDVVKNAVSRSLPLELYD